MQANKTLVAYDFRDHPVSLAAAFHLSSAIIFGCGRCLCMINPIKVTISALLFYMCDELLKLSLCVIRLCENCYYCYVPF